ncbi:MAG: SpoIIE family protein phosphatase [Salinivirgaceae bacterium]
MLKLLINNSILLVVLAAAGWAIVIVGVLAKTLIAKKRKTNGSVDIDILRHENQKMKQNLDFMSLANNSTDNLVIITDERGFVKYVNRSLSGYLGIKVTDNHLEQSIFEIEGFDKIKDLFLDAVERKSTIRTELFFTNKFNHRFWLQIVFSHVLGTDSHRIIITATNINELKYAEEEISQQREELMVQSEQLESMYAKLDHVNQMTTDSINYAQRIQQAILPEPSEYLNYLQDSFVFFRPRDIVSGDFYWYGEVYEKIVFVEADCTGHGVPGALMATIGNTLLNEIVLSKNILNPANILKELDESIKSLLKQDSHADDSTEGMDMTVVVYDPENRVVSISLAAQFMYFYHEGEFLELEGSLFGLGSSDLREVEKEFDLYRYVVSPGDIAYMFSDGYRDQYSEGENEKLMRGRFCEIIEKIADLPLDEQKDMLAEYFDKWRGNTRQFDDVLVWALQF